MVNNKSIGKQWKERKKFGKKTLKFDETSNDKTRLTKIAQNVRKLGKRSARIVTLKEGRLPAGKLGNGDIGAMVARGKHALYVEPLRKKKK